MQIANPKGRTLVTDGDTFFQKVDTQRAPNQLEPGTVADATNTRFEFGSAWPRHGIAAQPWGDAGTELVNGLAFDVIGPAFRKNVASLLTVGESYYFISGSALENLVFYNAETQVNESITGAGWFTYTTGTVYIYGGLASTGNPNIQSRLIAAAGPLVFGRFNDPDGVDNLVLITDELRSDGGVGKAWRIKSGSAPQEISLNGHDVWERSRFTQAYNGLLLFRPGAERHYFAAAAVNTTSDTFTLNCVPAWNIGDLVQFNLADSNSTLVGSASPNVGATYYVGDNGTTSTASAASTAVVTLHTTRAGALANTGKLDYSSAVGRFYLTRAAEQPGYFGNGCPPLLMQGSATQTCFEVGFKSLATAVAISATNGSSEVSAPNHRLIPGDAVTFGTTTYFTAGTKYVRPLSEHAFTVHATQEEALANTGAINAAATGTDSVVRQGANGLPLPPAKFGIFYKQRILALGEKVVTIGDPLDPLHCTPFLNSLPANQGESDRPTALVPLGEDVVLVLKENSILGLTGLGQDYSAWTEIAVTREYGCIAPATAVIVGKDAWMLSRRGVMSVTQTVQGILQGVTDPVSRPMKKYFDQIDWANASQAAAATWNNRYFIAVPLKGQTDTIKNNLVLVYNFLNQGWEGAWSGDAIEVFEFARHQVFGEETLCFVDYSAQVKFLTEGYTDSAAAAISTSVTTRQYFNNQRVLATVADLNWDSANASVTVQAQAPGYNEIATVRSGITYDRTKYVKFGVTDYNPSTSTTEDFDRAKRQDYTTSAEELLVGKVDVYQNVSERAQLRVDDLGVQIVVSNARGAIRLNSVQVQGTLKPRGFKRRV